jgi:hypothetical protein
MVSSGVDREIDDSGITNWRLSSEMLARKRTRSTGSQWADRIASRNWATR